MSISGFQAGQDSRRAGRSLNGLALGIGSRRGFVFAAPRRSSVASGLLAGTAAVTLAMFFPGAALANCLNSGGDIACTNNTTSDTYNVDKPTSDVTSTATSNFTNGGLTVDNSAKATNNIDFQTNESLGGASKWDYNANDHAVELISGLNGTVWVDTVAGTKINITNTGSSTDGLRLRTGAGSNPASHLGAGTINVNLIGTNISTAGRSEGVDAGAGSGGIIINVSSGKDSQGNGFAGDITSDDSHAISATAGSGGSVAITINKDTAGVGSAPSITGDEAGIYARATENSASVSGNVTVTNYAHIEGTGGAGVDLAAESGTVTLKNYSYDSLIGATDGGYLHDSNKAVVDNQGGFLVGLSNEGIRVENIHGFNLNGAPAVDILNSKAGIAEGYWDGIDIDDVWNGDVVIDNAGYRENDTNYSGGVIVGVHGDGIDISEADGSVRIHNDYTGTLGSVDFADLDAKATFAGGIFSSTSFNSASGVTGGAIGGIWGYTNGIKIEDAGEPQYDKSGNVYLGNVQGIVVGLTEDGLHWRDLASVYDGNNYVSATIDNTDGMLWGGDDGVDIERTQGDVNINNQTLDDDDSNSPTYGQTLPGGKIVGVDDGVRLRRIEGDVNIRNDGGSIYGFHGDGIDIRHVFDGSTHNGENGGNVVVRNASSSEDYLGGGTIIAADSAIRIFDARSARIYNGENGVIIGDGSYSQAVINLQTDDDGDGQDAGAYVYNAGIMGSLDLPYLDYDWAWNKAANTAPATTFDAQAIWDDLDDFGDYFYSVGQNGDITNLPDYADAAQDVLVRSRWSTNDNTYSGGGTEIVNDGFMAGRVRLTGRVEDGMDTYGNRVENYGTWFTQDKGQYGNSMHGSDDDTIANAGIIQTAFNSDNSEKATFDQDLFYNGYDGRYGSISMLDNGTGDTIDILEQFEGGGEGSYLVVDTFIGTEYDLDTSSDIMNLVDGMGGSSVYGSTGIVVHNLNGGPSGLNYYGIDVVEYDNNTYVDNNCGGMSGSLCREGDAFFISEETPNYINIGGYGAIQNGFFATFLRQDYAWNDFELITDWGVDAHALPNLVTGAQNIWYETGGVVQDHIYGNHFPLAGAGGGGADMAEPLPVVEAVGGPALWGKVSGSWTSRDTEVTDDIGGTPVTFDTSYDQDTYSILAGVDFTNSNAWRFGVFGGYISSNMDFDNYGLSGDYSGGTVGAYAAYTAGAYYADAEVKADFLSLDYTSAALGEPSADVTNIGVLANTGYRFDMGRMYFEPIASFAYLNSSVDGGNYGGAEVDFDDGTSLRGGLGARVGGSFATGAGTTELAVLGKVWNEFEDANSVTLTDNISGDSQTFQDDIDGVFGEVAGTATYYNADRSLSGFIGGGVKFNSDFTTVSAQAGLRKRF